MTLSLEQMVALTNLIGLFMILSNLLSLTSLMFGDILIEKYSLETKFPKLARFIQIKKKVGKKFIVLYTVSLYLTILAFVAINLYMFLLSYLA